MLAGYDSDTSSSSHHHENENDSDDVHVVSQVEKRKSDIDQEKSNIQTGYSKKQILPSFIENGSQGPLRAVPVVHKQQMNSNSNEKKSNNDKTTSKSVLVPPQVMQKRKNINTEDLGKWNTAKTMSKMIP